MSQDLGPFVDRLKAEFPDARYCVAEIFDYAHELGMLVGNGERSRVVRVAFPPTAEQLDAAIADLQARWRKH